MLKFLITYLPVLFWIFLSGAGILLSSRAMRRFHNRIDSLSIPKLREQLGIRYDQILYLLKQHQKEERYRFAIQLDFILIGLIALLPNIVSAIITYFHVTSSSLIQFPVAAFVGWIVALGLVLAEVFSILKAVSLENSEREFTRIVENSHTAQHPERFGFERLFYVMPDAVILTDMTHVQETIPGKILLWNPGAERIFGWKAEKAIGRNISIIIPERFIEAHLEGVNSYSLTGMGNLIELSVPILLPAKHADGHEFDILLRLYPVRDDHNPDQRLVLGIARPASELPIRLTEPR